MQGNEKVTGALAAVPAGDTQQDRARGRVGDVTDREREAPMVACSKCGRESPAGTVNCPGGCGFLPANPAGLVVGHRGRHFWREHDRMYRGTCEEIAVDLGHDSYDDAPAAARAAISGLAQAVLVRDSAYRRVVEDGGPLSSKGRVRRAAKVQQDYDRRAESWARQLGLKRKPKPTRSLAEAWKKPSNEFDGEPEADDAGENDGGGACRST